MVAGVRELGALVAKLSTILDQIDSGTVLLPEFQRGYVWNREQVRGLMRSLYLGYPVGSLLVWETEADPGAVRGDALVAAGVRLLLLDGQQRITTLYGIVRGKPPAFFEGKAEAFTGLHFNVEDKTFEFYAPAKMKSDPLWVDVSAVFAPDGIKEAMAALTAGGVAGDDSLKHMSRLIDLRNILDKEFHQEKITGADKTVATVVDIFNKVNSGGTKLSQGDLALAKICAEVPQVRSHMRDLLNRWGTRGYNFQLDWLLRNVNAVTTGRAQFSALDGVRPADVVGALERTRRHVETFLQLVEGRLGLDHNRVLMGRYAVPVVSRLLELQGGSFSDQRQRDAVLYWYIHAAIWGRFTGSVESFLTRDYETAADGGIDGLIMSLERWRGGNLHLEPHDFEGYGMGSRFYPLLYLMTRVLEARDLGTGNPLRAEMLGHLSGLQVHHIFPKAFLYEHGYPQNLVNSVSNFAFLTQATNLEIGMRAPSDYLAEVAEKEPGALESQWIPVDAELWRPERYPDFLAARQRLLADAANGFLDRLRSGRVPEGAPMRAAPPAEAEADERTLDVIQAVDALERLGCVRAELDVEVSDPESGRVLAVAEAAWLDGLQPGMDSPVVLDLDPGEADIARLEELGYRVFASTASLLGFARRAVGELEPNPPDVAPTPVGDDGSSTVETPEREQKEAADPDREVADLAAFGDAMLGVYQRAKSEAGYNATLYIRMLSERGPLVTAHHLLGAPHTSDGFAALWEKGRLDLTVEAVVLRAEFRSLFSEDELATAESRLRDHGHTRASD